MLKHHYSLFNSFEESCSKAKHDAWYNAIRGIVSERISDERDRVPSNTSMWSHWLHCCWVRLMWGNSSQVNIHEALPQPETCGWNKESDGSFSFDWECNKVQQSVQTSNFFDEGVFLQKRMWKAEVWLHQKWPQVWTQLPVSQLLERSVIFSSTITWWLQ